MYNLFKLLKNTCNLPQYISGVVRASRNPVSSYTLTFEKEGNGNWYIVLPEWKGQHENLKMVRGSDLLLNHLCKEGTNKVTVEVTKGPEQIPGFEVPGYIYCKRIESSAGGGATYTVSKCQGFNHTIWICPVTLFVLGEYPKNIYIKQLK